jgi:hypothetical protein
MADQIDYRVVRREVEKQLKQQKIAGRFAFAAVNTLLFIIFSVIALSATSSAGMSDSVQGAVIMLWVGYLVATIFHLIAPIFDLKSVEDNMRQQIVGRVIGSELLKLDADEAVEASQKRKNTYALSDDGELEVVETPDAADPVDAEIKRALRR